MNYTKYRRIAWLALVVFAALLIKYIYLRTAERLVDIEELPLDPLRIASGVAGTSDFGSGRLYNFNYLTNTIFLKIFGFKIASLKLTSLFFYLLSCIGILKIGYAWFNKHPTWVKWLPFALIAFGPPVAQMWALKNRGGFIETWAILTWVIWLYGKWCERPTDFSLLFMLGSLCGLALWAQPIALVFVVPVFLGVIWHSFPRGWLAVGSSVMRLSFSTLLGVMPLIALNFLFNFNTFKVISGGEFGLGAATPLERFERLFREGLPRLAGLKQQWVEPWVLPRPLSIAIFALFSLMVLIAFGYVVKHFIRERKFDAKVLAALSACMVLLANVVSSWGSFQGEPRRLLLLYVPLALLMVWTFVGTRRLLVFFAISWFSVSAVSNFNYVRANVRGFNNPFYTSYAPIAKFLVERHLDNVYAGVWVGAKIEFDSDMRIGVKKNPYVGPVKNIGNVYQFSYRSAAIFHNVEPGHVAAFNAMIDDVRLLGIECMQKVDASFSIVYGCSRTFDLYKLPLIASQVRKFEAAGEIFDAKKYDNGSLPGFYNGDGSIVWTTPEFSLPFSQKSRERGYLCIRYDGRPNLKPSQINLDLDYSEIALVSPSGSDLGHVAISSRLIEVFTGAHRIDISTPVFLPVRRGGDDLRPLGLELNSVSLVAEPSACSSSFPQSTN